MPTGSASVVSLLWDRWPLLGCTLSTPALFHLLKNTNSSHPGSVPSYGTLLLSATQVTPAHILARVLLLTNTARGSRVTV